MPWSHPAPRMREFVLALRAIWACWQDGTKLDFRGDFYTHTLMTPFFSPAPHEFGPPPVYPRRRRDAHDRGRGRGVRRLLLPPVHHAATCARSRCPRLARPGQGRAAGSTASRSPGRPSPASGETRKSWPRRSRAPRTRSRSTRRRPPTGACSSSTAGVISSPSSPGSRRKAAGRTWATPSMTRCFTRSPSSVILGQSARACARPVGRPLRPLGAFCTPRTRDPAVSLESRTPIRA